MPWLDTLTIPEPSNVPAGIYVFQGVAVAGSSRVPNPFVQISEEGQIDLVWSSNSGRLWTYNESSDDITGGVYVATGVLANVQSQIMSYEFTTGGHVVLDALNKTDVIGKLVPDE